MLRSMLLTAAAASALLAVPAAQAQTSPQPPAAQAAPSPAAPDAPPQSAAESATVIDALRARGDFTALLAALDRAGLTETLASRPAISIFAPTDAAFAALPEEERARLLDPANAAELRERLLYHVIVADVASGQIEGTRGGVQTAARTEVQLDGTGDAIKVDNATVVQADIGAANGAIFAIDQVLDPARSLAAMGDSETAVSEEAAETPAEAPADEAAAEEAPSNTPPTLPAERTAPDAAPTTSPSPATANPAPAAPTAPETAPTPGSAPAAAPATGQTAPNGQPAATVTTVQSPPVQNPTDGQVDDEEDPLNPAPTPDE